MTAIAAMVEPDGTMWMSGDSASVGDDYTLRIRKRDKVISRPGYLIGSVGSIRQAQVIEHELMLPELPPYLSESKTPEFHNANMFHFMVTEFVPALKDCLRTHDVQSEDVEVPLLGPMIVATRGVLFDVLCDYQVGELSVPYTAQGSGADLLMGSIHSQLALKESLGLDDLLPGHILGNAMTAAAEFSTSVSPPFTLAVMRADG